MKTLLRATPVILVTAAAFGLAFRPAPALTGPRALIVVSYGDDGANLATTTDAMDARLWTTESVHYSGLVAESANLSANWDVIWVLPGADHAMLSELSNGILDDFAQNGGAVILPGVHATENSGIDLLPGGVDVFPDAFPGTTSIQSPTHPLIAAAAIGGSNLTVADLDPNGTGGGCIVSTGIVCECLAENATGPVLATYDLGAGHVVMSVFDMLDNACLDNLLIYTEGVVTGL